MIATIAPVDAALTFPTATARRLVAGHLARLDRIEALLRAEKPKIVRWRDRLYVLEVLE